MALTREKIIENLKARGLRVTPQRYGVYANLLQRQDHPSAEQLLLDLNQEAPTSSQATVYSSLKALQSVGLVREVLLEGGICRYDANIEPHHHFCCRHCGAIEDISWEKFPPVDLSQLRPGLTPERYEVIVHGICEHCSSPSVNT